MLPEITFVEKINSLNRVYKKPVISAKMRMTDADFKVEEELSFKPSGKGEHLFLQIKKINANTDWIAKQLQKIFGLSSREIGYAGKKDRHSISTQWFSLHLPGRDVDLSKFDAIKTTDSEIHIINSVRHNKKLKIGSLRENKFEIVLRKLTGEIDLKNIETIRRCGVPNYFGYQRFGFDANNLVMADQYLGQEINIKNRNKRGLVISSARSLLFNLILSSRIKNDSWSQVIPGDCLMLDASQSYFLVKGNPEKEQQRIDSGDVHVTGLLPGREPSDASLSAKVIEDQIINQFPKWMEAFFRLNLTTSRRALRCKPRDFVVEQQADKAVLKFTLNKGCYATSVIRELVNVTDESLAKTREIVNQ